MRRHTQINSVPTPEYGWEEIARITEAGVEATIAIPNIYEKIGLFIVGGGSSGACEHNASGWAGNGGNGGQVIHKIVDYTNSSVTVFVGRGGNRTSTGTDKPSNPGVDSYIVYNSQTFVAAGGLGPPTTEATYNTKVEYSGIGGYCVRYGDQTNNRLYPASGEDKNGAIGEYGILNQFDPYDANLYGAGGGAGFNSYNYWRTYGNIIPNGIAGGETGGGGGGYGPDNDALNAGRDATFYGAGGGGGAFSSNHRYGCGGAGYQGIVIVYGKR